MGICESISNKQETQNNQFIKSSFLISKEPSINIPLNIENKLRSSICNISYNKNNNIKKGTGFFIQLNDYKCLMTNYIELPQELIDEFIVIKIYNNKSIKIQLNEIYTKFYNALNMTIIQLNDLNTINYIINDIYFLDYNSDYNKGYEQYLNTEIFIFQYPRDSIEVSNGTIRQILNANKFKHNITNVSSGAPIILGNLFKVIGIHIEGDINKELYNGIFIGEIFKYNNFIKVINNNNFSVPNNNIMMNNFNNGYYGMNNCNYMMMNNNYNNNFVIPNNNSMMNNYGNYNMGTPNMMNNNNYNYSTEGIGEINRGIMNYNNYQDQKIDIIFDYFGTKNVISCNLGTTVDEALNKYLNNFCRYDLIKSNKIYFLHNGKSIMRGDRTTVEIYFKNTPYPKIEVIESGTLTGQNL